MATGASTQGRLLTLNTLFFDKFQLRFQDLHGHFRRCCQLVTMHDASNNGETKQKLGELVREALRQSLSWQHEKLTKDCNLWDHLRVIDLVVHCTEYEVAKV